MPQQHPIIDRISSTRFHFVSYSSYKVVVKNNTKFVAKALKQGANVNSIETELLKLFIANSARFDIFNQYKRFALIPHVREDN